MRIIVAFLVAPILPALPPTWFLHANDPNRMAISGFIVVCGLFYLLQAVIGIPAYIFAGSKRRYVWFYLLLGLLGMAVSSIAVTVVFSTGKNGITEALLTAAYLGGLGAGIGLIFWLIARPDKRAAAGS
ncbi:hypothetical protein JIR23_00500 [Bradyrhizobium diazoefficiens]|nr:hypothetical protein [Bradyrhizobium diazoefficiens]QQN64341.1 hypothetical protein JIR23_00500 [Bradyrhizobium diazoefficiens]